MNILHKYVNPLVRKYLNPWTSMHMLSGACIGFVLQHFTEIPNVGILVWTFIIAVTWEIFETTFYETKELMYVDYGGKKIWVSDCVIDIVVAIMMSALVIY